MNDETLLKRIEELVKQPRNNRLKSLEDEVARLKRRLENLEAWYRHPPTYPTTMPVPATPWWQPQYVPKMRESDNA